MESAKKVFVVAGEALNGLLEESGEGEQQLVPGSDDWAVGSVGSRW